MVKRIKPLAVTQINNAKPRDKEYSLADGNGLYLRITPNGTKAWIFNYIHPVTKKRKNIGLGKFPEITLASAREKCRTMRQQVAEGIDPKTFRDNAAVAQQLSNEMTLIRVAEEWFEVKKDSITDDYATDIWRSLELHIFSNLGKLPVSEILAPTVIKQLRPLEQRGALETIKRVCQRLNEVMIYAVNSGKIQANPLANIRQVFKKPKAENMKTIRPDELPQLMKRMSEVNVKLVTRCAFEFQLHTLVRPVECAQAEWAEIDFDSNLWVIPKNKMKMNRNHKIPLSEAAIRLLEFMKPISLGQQYVCKRSVLDIIPNFQ